MALSPTTDLAIAKIVFFSLAFIISIPVLLRHGFRREAGFLTILILSTLRLIGASCTLYSDIHQDFSRSLLEAAFITSYIGAGALLFTLRSFVGRVDASLSKGRASAAVVPSLVFRLAELLTLAAVILSIVGAVKEGESSDDASSASTGHSLLEAAGFLFLAIWVVLAFTLVYLLFTVVRKQGYSNNSSRLSSDDRLLIIIGTISLPFLLVRLVYGIATAFSHPGAAFSPQGGSIYVQAFMEFAMEAIVVCLFVFAGLKVARAVKSTASDADKEVDGVHEHDTKHLEWIAREAQSSRRS